MFAIRPDLSMDLKDDRFNKHVFHYMEPIDIHMCFLIQATPLLALIHHDTDYTLLEKLMSFSPPHSNDGFDTLSPEDRAIKDEYTAFIVEGEYDEKNIWTEDVARLALAELPPNSGFGKVPSFVTSTFPAHPNEHAMYGSRPHFPGLYWFS